MTRTLFILVLLSATASPVWADRFENAYLSFELPKGWTCKLEGTEFVCEPAGAEHQPKDAIMILTAKDASAEDTLAAYQRHLAQDPPATGRGSIVVPPRLTTINDTIWVDATLSGSEIPGYRTRYLATARDGLAVLFTVSVERTRYDSLVGAALLAVRTLKLKATWRDSTYRR